MLRKLQWLVTLSLTKWWLGSFTGPAKEPSYTLTFLTTLSLILMPLVSTIIELLLGTLGTPSMIHMCRGSHVLAPPRYVILRRLATRTPQVVWLCDFVLFVLICSRELYFVCWFVHVGMQCFKREGQEKNVNYMLKWLCMFRLIFWTNNILK